MLDGRVPSINSDGSRPLLAAAERERDARTPTEDRTGYSAHEEDEEGEYYDEDVPAPRGGACSEPELEPERAPATGGYSSESAEPRGPRLPRGANRRPPLSFDRPRGATAATRGQRQPGGGSRLRPPSRPGTRRPPVCRELGATSLVWTGNSPAPAHAPSPAFPGLPPLGFDARDASPPTDASGQLAHRCTSYCVALGLELVVLYRHLMGGPGAPAAGPPGRSFRMHKDGINAILHCHVHGERFVLDGSGLSNGGGRDAGSSERDAHIFYFSYGCVVTWGLSEAEEQETIAGIEGCGCAQEPIKDEHEVDDFGYVYLPAGGKTTVAKDVVHLATLDVREKLAVAFALAQSVKLGVFERTVEQTIQDTKSIPERMAVDGQIKLKRSEITKRIGQLFVDRASINLHSDILDHPEFFWEDDEWLPVYLRASKYLEVDRRAEVLNKRLDIIKELFDMLANELQNSHGNKLEWIIIILILVEVVFQMFSILIDWYHS